MVSKTQEGIQEKVLFLLSSKLIPLAEYQCQVAMDCNTCNHNETEICYQNVNDK